MHLKEKVKNLPLTPGVYLMKDSLGNIIYVGKAKKLKQRVQSYFQDAKNHTKKVKKLVKTIDDFDIIHSDTEFEAFILECQLIREIKPFYNSRMKSPQTYPYIVITSGKGIRVIEISTNPSQYKDKNCLIFGPYTSKNAVSNGIQAIKECYKINCSNLGLRNSACLNYSLGSCIGICRGGAALEQYEKVLNKIIALLNGKDMGILEEMKQKMALASENFDFEKAAKYRDDIDAVTGLINRKKVLTFAEKPKNIAVIEALDDSTIKFFLIKGNKVLFKEKYVLESIGIEQLKSRVRLIFTRRKGRTSHEVDQDEIDEAQIIYSYLKGSDSRYTIIPQTWLNAENSEKLDKSLTTLLE